MPMEKIRGVKGQVVKIYEDPITKNHEEGGAKLINFISKLQNGLEYWSVEFIEEPGITFERSIMF